MAFYIESADRPLKSRVAAEDIHIGELVIENGSDNVRRVDAQNDSRFDGVADNPRSGDHIALDDDDTSNIGVYLSSENDRVVYGGSADGDIIKARTAEDPGGNESAPDISDGDVVGVVDTSAGSLSSTGEYKGRVVEEGYVDGDGTTYNRSNSNFLAIGVAYKPSPDPTSDTVNAYDEPVRIEVRKDL